MKKLLLWALVIFLVLSAIVFFPSFATLIYLGLAIVVAPITRIQSAIHSKLPKVLHIVLVIILFLFAALISPSDENNGSTYTETTTTFSEKEELTTLEITTIETTTSWTTTKTETESYQSESEINIGTTTENLSLETTGVETVYTTSIVETSAVETIATTQTEQITVESTTKQEQMVWIPESGKKYHSKSSCSNMQNPIQVTISQAKNMGYEPCKRCH